MNKIAIHYVFPVLLLLCCLGACQQTKRTGPIIGEYVIHVTEADEHKPLTGNPDLSISSETSVRLNGAVGSLQKVGERFRISFEGENAEGFKIVRAGNKDGGKIWFWLEFTDSGNCVMYSDTGANVFVKFQRPNQKT